MTLEELIEQKREIERQIKALKGEQTECGRAKIERRTYPGRESEWIISVKKVIGEEVDSQERWSPIIIDHDKADCLGGIDSIINSLQMLKGKGED